MIYVLYTLFVLSCLTLIVSVLLQPGKADAGALFTSSVSSTAFGPRGTQTLLAKITIGAAALFLLSALLLSVPYFTGGRSVLQSVDETSEPVATPVPAAPAASPATPTGNATADNANAGATTGGASNANAGQNSQSNANK
ncbi:MAG: preprotein translocase subunit SecG [Acidobacteria bacterium]|nr:preprotein translocase subunit SecG [Acidobacteriota bacterium]MCA1643449.1 preprotein translocase subunit SecG [Acidobacteriota bacterium]